MTEINDKIVTNFFQKEKKEVEDNGFSRRVMRNLPDRGQRLSTIWAMFCTIIGIILFFVFDGLEAILNLLREVFYGAMQTGLAHIDLKSLLIAAIVIISLGVKKICSTE
ncbi:DUF5056 domain-containing protein [uncultured Bacteroides sp.]|uniref:DUF5056 domain-containing protein n=1 Tax=uncultured Bacteroides sp. TaxID=162156 RepID=UPI002AAA79B0|nr:DUF5056 domain-containing protein [uncultured Bacteroides sp.]